MLLCVETVAAQALRNRWQQSKGFIVAHPARCSFQHPWEDSIARKVLPGFM